MSQTLELPDRIFDALTAAATRDGVTAAEWLAMQLRLTQASDSEQPLSELLSGLIGSIESSTSENSSRTPFSKSLAEKFRKQGLRVS